MIKYKETQQQLCGILLCIKLHGCDDIYCILYSFLIIRYKNHQRTPVHKHQVQQKIQLRLYTRMSVVD